ncbi:uncharacterized protein DUF1992 [Paenibacillus taihuensis]|uniref:Uncharacterized protein DUF1992 n=1 Tax=Paenibacillus taihuensis TaxID=1156355 RepID=A0A3D9QVV3_9BACL|nr:DUF1992 domain-containing protein [Paenibacillus taihuensis]REE67584.1 uncharacterized protein DUF1992 [Paenibacillus taihuensis]
MRFWFKKNKKPIVSEAAPTPAPLETNEVQPDTKPSDMPATDTAVPSRQYWNSGMSAQDWISEMYREQERKGAFEHLAGKGKPLHVSSGDMMNSILKESNFLPPWLTLQHEIRDQLQRLLETGSAAISESELGDINEKINKYNSMVPSPVLQKWKLTRENWRQQIERWKS